jgi:hypothetical protein
VVTGRAQQPVTGAGRIIQPKPPKPKPVAAKPAVAAPPPAAPTPAPVAAPVAPLAPPPDATYEQQVATYRRNRDDQLAALATGRQTGLSDYGYNATFDPTGAVTGLSVDPNNPFSKAALLKRTFDQSRKANVTGFANQGQLYSGALQTTQDESQRSQAQGEDAQQKSLIQFLTQNLGSQKKAQTDFDTNVAAAESDRLSRIADSPLYSPSQDTPAGAAVAAGKPAASSAALEVWQKGTYKGRKATYKNGKWYYATASGKLAPIPGAS